MNKEYQHISLNSVQKNSIIFASFSKRNFYLRAHISQFVLLQGQTPISPFMNVDYNLNGLVDKSLIRIANNTMISRCDELWVFGEISDGVLVEIYLAKRAGKPVHYYELMLDGQTFHEIDEQSVRLEDVSPWMWEWALSGKDLARWHPRLRFNKTHPLIYPAYSKRNFYLQTHISQFCLDAKTVPLNPFMLFRYFLGGSVTRESVYQANNNIVRECDEVWVFGEISNGVLAEIKLKQEQGKPVRYFKINNQHPITFRASSGKTMPFEEAYLEEFRYMLT
ncbi:MAG TPA: DUF4406 domain-containing protein [Candidatus Saccharimonadales bacterium]|nr:DUF4406 domain-containing protein [Candidatus Saccharimonadales bacterium]